MPNKLVFSYSHPENKKLVLPWFLKTRKSSEKLKAENKMISTEDFTSWLNSCSLNGIDVSKIKPEILEESNTEAAKGIFKTLLFSQKPADDFSGQNLKNFNRALKNIQANTSLKETHTEPATSASRDAITGVQDNPVNSKHETARDKSHTNEPIKGVGEQPVNSKHKTTRDKSHTMGIGERPVSTTPQQKDDANAQALKAQIEIAVGLAIEAGVGSISKQEEAEAAKVRSETARISANNAKKALQLKTSDFETIQTSIVDTNTQLETKKNTIKLPFRTLVSTFPN